MPNEILGNTLKSKSYLAKVFGDGGSAKLGFAS